MSSRALPRRELIEVVGVLGVITSLVFVAMEIRQNTNAVRSATIQAISDQAFQMNAFMVENADLRAAFAAEDIGDATPDQSRQVRSFWGAQLRAQQNRFLQIKLGILDEDIASQIRGTGEGGDGGFGRSFARHWAVMRRNYPADFVVYMDSLLLAGPKTD